MARVFVSIVVDDLDARTDPARSFRDCTYDATPDQIEQLRQMIQSWGRVPQPPQVSDARTGTDKSGKG